MAELLAEVDRAFDRARELTLEQRFVEAEPLLAKAADHSILLDLPDEHGQWNPGLKRRVLEAFVRYGLVVASVSQRIRVSG